VRVVVYACAPLAWTLEILGEQRLAMLLLDSALSLRNHGLCTSETLLINSVFTTGSERMRRRNGYLERENDAKINKSGQIS
jgi:hypothetical protein